MLRVWDSYSAKFLNSLKGHTEDIYILETHPTEEHIILSAGGSYFAVIFSRQ